MRGADCRLPLKLIAGGVIAGIASCVWAVAHIDRTMSSISTGLNDIVDAEDLPDVLGPGMQQLGTFPTAVYVLGAVGILSLLVGIVLLFRTGKQAADKCCH